MSHDLRTKAIVLRRTNYGESDRILSLITPSGKINVLAKGARKEKSRLAGGIELFCLADVVIHQGRGELGILTSAKMSQSYHGLLADLTLLELAGNILKKINRASEQVSNPQFFELTKAALAALDAKLSSQLVEAWLNLNLATASGEEVNLLCDSTGQPLQPDTTYFWDYGENCFRPDPRGNITANHIKFLRLLLSTPLTTAARVQGLDELLPAVAQIARTFE